MNSREALERIIKSHHIAMAMLCEGRKDDETEKAIETIKQDLEDYSIIREIEDNVRAGKRVIVNGKKYSACEFILAEEGNPRHLTIWAYRHIIVLNFKDYKTYWKFED